MKKNLYLFLLIIVPFICKSQTHFRSGRFLHHSTGGNIWGPNGSSTSIQDQIAIYNTAHGYTGDDLVEMDQQWWPSGGNNEWEYWRRIFDNQAPEANILPILTNNKIVVIKSCFPSSEITGPGQPSDTLIYTRKTVYNYKWHWRHIVQVMAQHPDNFFVIWTNAPLLATNTNPAAALLTKNFCKWAKDTLAQGIDPELGVFPPNIYVFDYFSKLTDASGYELPQFAVGSEDSHPNSAATELVAPQFVTEIFDAALFYEQGEQTLRLSVLLEGLYAGNGTMNQALDELGPHFAPGIADLITIELRNAQDYSIVEYTATEVELSTTGMAQMSLPATFVGNYYITVKHRNSIEVTSANPVSFSSPLVNHAFTQPSGVWGANLMLMPDGYYALFGGDVNMDGFVDTADVSPVDNDTSNFVSGYLSNDVNCDGSVDTADMTIVDNNVTGFISAVTP